MSLPNLPEGAWERRDEPEIREAIIMAYWPMLTRVVGRLRQGLPPHVRIEEDDLRAYGVIGLYRALDRFDPSLGHPFDKFASNFVRGAVLDELRSQDWAPRSLRKRQKDLARAMQTVSRDLGRVPEDFELAEELGWTTHDVRTTRRQVDTAWPRSLDEIRHTARETDFYAVVASAQGTPEEAVVGSMDSHENDRSTLLVSAVAEFIAKMSPRKKVVLVLCYYLDLRQADVAKVLGVPEAKVSELHQSVMEDIYARLTHLLGSPRT